ncbi:KRI1-like family C-terminal-domain-containing protein [Gautieria morchelliformis]|nr:KRI1-like family C-terminal-domain-containing protein [Gautieria morchelliformis]
MLSDSVSEDGSEDIKLTINEHFANAYAAKKEREELDKRLSKLIKEKYGSDAEEEMSEEDSEDAESEDEDGEELTPAVDAAILRTLAKIKRKDPDIYDKDKGIFEQEQERTGQVALRSKPSARDNMKPLTIKQHALSSMLHAASHTPSPEPEAITHDQEQVKLRSETISAFHHAVDETADDGLLVLREKTKDDVEREEEAYQEYLKREVGEDIRDLVTIEDDSVATRVHDEDGGEAGESVPKAKKKRKSRKGKEQETPETDQEFLMNYILNRGWIDRSAKRVPTYKDITQIETVEPEAPPVLDEAEQEGSLNDEDEFEDIVDRFESSYNFRFEEPDAAVIPKHPRNLPSIVRRQDTTRKEARERRKQRKEEELKSKKEEVRRMKALKMKELRRKLEQIGREGGVEIDTEGRTCFVDFDLDGDWDPEKHDRQMAGLYDDEELEDDVEKPQWTDNIDIGDILSTTAGGPSESKSKKKKKKRKVDEADPDGVDVNAMDADVPGTHEEEWDGTEEMRKRKVQEYMDEVYGMDFNDMVGDMPTRFNYTAVAPQSYALTPAEIMLATDAELNEYMGIKRIAPYRKDGRWDVKRADRLKELKSKLKGRSWVPGQADAEEMDGKKSKKRKGKKERQRAKAVGEGEEDSKTSEELPPAKKRRKEGL